MPVRAAAPVSTLLVCASLLAGMALGMPQVRADDDLRAHYGAAMRDAVQRAWRLPGGIQAGTRCRLAIQQLPGGEVLAVEAMPDCAFDAVARDSLMRAVHHAAPLPYAGFERVFSRGLTITFTAGAP